MSETDLHIKWWQLDAGLRFLRMMSPEYAEYEYAFEKEEERLVQGLMSEAKLDSNGAYNLIRREITGRKRNITHFPDGSSRSWTGEIPDEFKNLPTIEPQVPEASSLHAVTTFLSEVARRLPDDIANVARIRLSEINDHRAPIVLPSDLSPLTMKSPSMEDARLRAQRAIVIMDFLDRIAPSGDRLNVDGANVEEFATKCRHTYANARLSGVLYAPLLLLLEIAEVAKPTWPFGNGLPRFVCGQLPCYHRICKENIRNVQIKNRGAGASATIVAPTCTRIYWATKQILLTFLF